MSPSCFKGNSSTVMPRSASGESWVISSSLCVTMWTSWDSFLQSKDWLSLTWLWYEKQQWDHEDIGHCIAIQYTLETLCLFLPLKEWLHQVDFRNKVESIMQQYWIRHFMSIYMLDIPAANLGELCLSQTLSQLIVESIEHIYEDCT